MAKATAKSTKAKKTKEQPAPAPETASEGPRRLKAPKYRSFQLQKRIKSSNALPGAFRLLSQTFKTFARHWKLFVGITLIYGLLNIVLVQGFSAAGNLSDIKSTLDEIFTGNFGKLAGAATAFVYLLSVSGNTLSPTAGAYQLVLTLVISLVLIWTLRQVYAKKAKKVRIRDGFYQGVGPLVQFILVFIVVGLQLIPFALGLLLYGTITSNGIAASPLEQILWATVLFTTAITSLYMISSSIFALYIVTLPGMTPVLALRSARKLVLSRRWAVLRKVVFLPVALILLSGVVIIPLILFITPIAAWAFFGVTMLLLPLIHGYMYALYRSLL